MTRKHGKLTAKKVVITSFLANIFDVLINLIIAAISGSVVVLSQALEGGADLIASGFLVWGVSRSKKPPDHKHPFGYGREIYFWAFLAAMSTFIITATLAFYFGLKRFLNPEPLEGIFLAYLAVAISIGTNGYSLSLGSRRLLGKNKLKSIRSVFTNSALIETKTTFVLDLMGTLASILGLIALVLYGLTGNSRFDGLGAMAIGITLAVLALFIIEAAKDLLVGRSAGPEVEDKIRKITESFTKVVRVLDLRTLHIGNEKLLVNMEVHLKDGLTTDEIELLIDNIERKIKKRIPSAKSIHIELESPDV